MRKISATLLNGNNKEEATLKIKDDSFVVVTSNDLIKIPHSDIKSYNYNDANEILTIKKFGGSSISIGIKKDRDLLIQLDNLVNTNKNITDENIDKKLENKSEKLEIEPNNNKDNTTDTHELSKEQNSQQSNNMTTDTHELPKEQNLHQSNNTTTDTNSSNNGIGGVIVFIVICIAIVWGISKSGFFRTFNRSAIGTWYNEAGTVLTIKKDGVCEVELSETDNFVLQFKQYYDWGDVKITKCEWKKDFNDETKASVLVYAEYGTLAFHDYLISNQFIHSDDWGGFKRK